MVAGRQFVRIARATAFLACAALAVQSCRDEATGPAAMLALELGAQAATQATVGSLLVPAPTFVIRDAGGHAVAGVPVAITVSAGGGELRNATRRSGPGPTPVGEWRLGTVSGRQALSVRAGNIPVLEIEVTAVPDAPAGLAVVSGNFQRAPAGDLLPQPIEVKVHDRFGNGIGDIPLTIDVASGGGSLSQGALTTDSRGIATVTGWRLGRQGGVQQLVVDGATQSATVDAVVESGFSPVVRFFGPVPSAEIQGRFLQAADRIHASVTGDLPDVPVFGFDLGRCGVQAPALTEAIDDVVIYATVTHVDGPGGILGSAGPCVMRSQSRFTVIGVMRFDEDDAQEMLEEGRLGDVILHEMLHIVGVGSLWRDKDLLFGGFSADPRFTGALAVTRCLAAGGQALCDQGSLPVENTGGGGTIGVHWRESAFDEELMTGFAEIGIPMPLSAITLASIEDMGLVVNYLAADPYLVPSTTTSLAPLLAPLPAWETLEPPRFDITPHGWLRPLPR